MDPKIPAHADLKSYTTWYYDYPSDELSLEVPWTRNVPLILARVLLTLILEGLIFFLMGYRESSSWLLFLITNLITQGLLNIGLSASVGGHVFYGYVFYETIIFVVEMAFLGATIKEHHKRRTITTVFLANLASLILGGWIIENLPL